MLGNYLQQMTSADVIFQMHFFGALKVKLLACLVMFHVFVVVCRLFIQNLPVQKYFKNTIRVSNWLDPDQDRHLWALIWIQTAWNGYQQTTKVAASNVHVPTTHVHIAVCDICKKNEIIKKNG